MTTPIAGYPSVKRREPLWDRVDRNRWRLVGHLSLFAVLGAAWFGALYLVLALVLATFAAETGLRVLAWPLAALVSGTAAGALGRLWAVGIAVTALYEWYALSRSERVLIKRLDAKLVAKGERLGAKLALKDMAIAAGMPVAPALYEIESTNVNAFIAESFGRRAVVGVTSGFLNRLSEAEQRAIFANLVARLKSGDIMLATAITALMAPIQSWRAERDRIQNERIDAETFGFSPGRLTDVDLVPLLGVPLVVLGEFAAAGHRRSQLEAAEKADAEGMLLLKDPQAMLAALQHCVEFDNVVPTAGEAYGELFYCWTGDSTNDDDDPEWTRVARLREVLGVEGWAHA